MANDTISTTERVFNAVVELRAADTFPTRETVAELTGLKQTIVDDRLRVLADEKRIRRVLRGVYDVCEQFPKPRPISQTALEGGLLKIEIGETCENLTPEECRMLGRMLMGYASEALTSESVRQHLMLATDLAAQVKALQQHVKALVAKRDERQLDLIGDDE
jgi:hypothetical protein